MLFIVELEENMREIDTLLKLKILCAQQCSSPGCSYYRVNHKGPSRKEGTKNKEKENQHTPGYSCYFVYNCFKKQGQTKTQKNTFNMVC